jgi:hypothetical protein
MQERLLRSLEDKVARLSATMERVNLAEYMRLLNNPWRLLWVNFLAGLARGVGMAIGGTLPFAFILFVMGRIAGWNLPVLSEFIANLVRMVEEQLTR